MEETPACRECKRTHTSTGNPVKLIFNGDCEGTCKACRNRLVYSTGALIDPRLIESDIRALNQYLARRRERIARNRRRVNVPLSH